MTIRPYQTNDRDTVVRLLEIGLCEQRVYADSAPSRTVSCDTEFQEHLNGLDTDQGAWLVYVAESTTPTGFVWLVQGEDPLGEKRGCKSDNRGEHAKSGRRCDSQSPLDDIVDAVAFFFADGIGAFANNNGVVDDNSQYQDKAK